MLVMHLVQVHTKEGPHVNSTSKFPVVSLTFPCPTANFCDNFGDLQLFYIMRTDFQDKFSF